MSFLKIYLIVLIFIFSYEAEENYIEQKIYINNQSDIKNIYPYINVTIGSKANQRLLISLFSPIIISFSNNEKEQINETEIIDNKYKIWNILNNDDEFLEFNIYKDNFKLNEKKEINLDYGVMNIDINKEVDGLCGLLPWSKGIENFNETNIFLNQLYAQKFISKKVIYISPYYKDDKLLKEAQLMIGKIPDEFEKNKNKMPNCSIVDSNEFGYFDCNISGIIFEDKNKTKNENKYMLNDIEYTIGIFIESNIQSISLPNKIFHYFEDYFITNKQCLFINNKINCKDKSEVINNTNISFILNDYKFKLNSKAFWNNNGELNIEFQRNDNIGILTSLFTGNYHRIYDFEEKKIFFEIGNNSESVKDDEEKSDTAIWIVIIIILFVLLSVSIFLVLLLSRTKDKKNLNEKINEISFKDDSRETKESKDSENKKNKLI